MQWKETSIVRRPESESWLSVHYFPGSLAKSPVKWDNSSPLLHAVGKIHSEMLMSTNTLADDPEGLRLGTLGRQVDALCILAADD